MTYKLAAGMIDVREYVTATGRSPFAAWFRKLDRRQAERADEALYRMRLGNLGDHKAVGPGLFERRIPFAPGLRVYFGKDDAIRSYTYTYPYTAAQAQPPGALR